MPSKPGVAVETGAEDRADTRLRRAHAALRPDVWGLCAIPVAICMATCAREGAFK
jgi:hypothetical protein